MVLLNRLSLLSAAALLSVAFAADAPDTSLPVSKLVANADALLARGDKNGALEHFDAAIKKDPSNYLTLFKRGATYLSLGRSSQASADFDSVLSLKPDFEAALLQRARLKARTGDWDAAREDYGKAGAEKNAETLKEINGAEEAAGEAHKAADNKDWDTCVERAGTAILVASGVHSLRSLRARCRMEKGDVHEAIGDLAHVAQLAPSSIEPHLRISNLLYFSLNDFDRATAQMRKCLHSDPDSKPCSRLFRRIKNYEKSINKVRQLRSKRQYTGAGKLLVGAGEDPGLIAEVKEDVAELKKDGYMNDKCPETLLGDLQEMACEGFSELKRPEKARPHCEEALRINPKSIPAILFKVDKLIKEDAFEEAIRLLESSKEDNEALVSDVRFKQRMRDAHALLRRSKSKDYYKVLGVDRDADDRTIKRAYRKLIKEYHPDKYRGSMNADEVQQKMSAINEAWEVLNNPELKARFDAGDDPNSQEQQNPFQQGGFPFGQAGFGGQQFVFRQQGGPFGGGFGGQGGFKFQF